MLISFPPWGRNELQGVEGWRGGAGIHAIWPQKQVLCLVGALSASEFYLHVKVKNIHLEKLQSNLFDGNQSKSREEKEAKSKQYCNNLTKYKCICRCYIKYYV